MRQHLEMWLIPEGSPRRTGSMKPKWITIHETSLGLGKEPSWKNVSYYRKKLSSYDSTIGYHFLIEANRFEIPVVYQFLESNVSTHHTGNDIGNAESIGIERLVNEDTWFDTAISLQAKLTATLMNMYEIPIERVVPHKYWSGKECPARLLAGQYDGWDGFIERVEYFYNDKQFIEGIL